MSWFKRHLGIDGVDLTVHVALTGLGVVMANTMFHGTLGELISWKVIAVSLLVFAWRRHRNLRIMTEEGAIGLTTGQVAAHRFAEMEERLAQLEANQARMAELEDRLDFAERLLAQPADEPSKLLAREGRDG